MALRTHFEDSLKSLYAAILELGATVEAAMRKALAAFISQDTAMAGEILREDAEVGRRQLEMEDQCIALIATEQPVASDLRRLMASMKVASNLERIGDHAVHLAEVAIRHAGESYLEAASEVEAMALRGIEMLHDAMDAFAAADPERVREVASRDDAVDAMHDRLVTELLQDMHRSPANINQALSLLTLTRFLERLGDHVASICEWILYGIEGDHVRLK